MPPGLRRLAVWARHIAAGPARLWRRIPGSTRWSRLRRFWSWWMMTVAAAMALEAAAAQHLGLAVFGRPGTPWILAGFSVAYFVMVIGAVIFLTSSDFTPSASRLAQDALVSTVFCVLAFATLYRLLGASLDEDCLRRAAAADTVYFSAVTFSTLGFGDFRPCPPARLVAAFQAIFGNLHLGVVVGAAFLFAQKARS